MSAPLLAAELAIDALGACLLPSPVASHVGVGAVHFVGAADKVLLDDSLSGLRALARAARARSAGVAKSRSQASTFGVIRWCHRGGILP